MNWSKGLFRLWLVLSALWLAGVVAVFATSWPPPVPSNYFDKFDEPSCNVLRNADGSIDPRKLTEEQLRCLTGGPISRASLEAKRQSDIDELLKKTAFAAIIPPTMLLFLGALGVWVSRGFCRT